MDDDKRVYTHQEALISEMLGDVGKLDKAIKNLGEELPVQAKKVCDSIDESTKWLNEATVLFKTQAEDFANELVDKIEKMNDESVATLNKKTNNSIAIIENDSRRVVGSLKQEVHMAVSSLVTSGVKEPLNKSVMLIVAICFVFSSVVIGVVYYLNSKQQEQSLTQHEQIVELLQKGNHKK